LWVQALRSRFTIINLNNDCGKLYSMGIFE
jgi:hypothetical protein